MIVETIADVCEAELRLDDKPGAQFQRAGVMAWLLHDMRRHIDEGRIVRWTGEQIADRLDRGVIRMTVSIAH